MVTVKKGFEKATKKKKTCVCACFFFRIIYMHLVNNTSKLMKRECCLGWYGGMGCASGTTPVQRAKKERVL